MLIYFEERAGYNIIIKKYQSVMLIEVINYDDKNVGTPSSHRMEAIISPLPALRKLCGLSGSNFYQIYNIYTVIPIYLYCLINIDQMYVIVIKSLFL